MQEKQETKFDIEEEKKVDFKLTKKQAWSFISAIIVGLVIFFVVPINLPWAARVTLALTTTIVVMWSLEPLPLTFTSLFIMAGLVVFGAAPLSDALQGFATGGVFLVVFGFMLARAVNSTTLAKRVAYFIMGKFGGTPGGALMGILITQQVMAFFIPALGVRTVMLLPTVLAIIATFKDQQADNTKKLLMLGLAYGTTISGLTFLPAALVNVLTVDILYRYTGESIMYFDWFLLAFPAALMLIPLTWVVLMKFFPPEIKVFPGGVDGLNKQLKELGPLDNKDKKCIMILIFVVILWISEGYHGWHPTVPVMIAVILMGMPTTGFVKWEEMLKIDWGTILLFGSAISLGYIFNDTGAASFVADVFLTLDPVVRMMTVPVLAVAFLTIFMQLFHLAFASSAPPAVIMIPLVVSLTYELGGNPLFLGFVTGLSALYGFVLVTETLSNLLTYSYGYYKSREMIMPGIVLSLLAILVNVFLALTWWPFIGAM